MTSKLYDEGMKVRRAVLGGEHVDRSTATADQYSKPLQELVTEYCWGAVWTRPGLERQQRSILNLGMLVALNRMHEFKLHVRGALSNGLTREQISEVVLQTAIYCGVPAAIDAMRNVREVFAEEDKK